MAETLRKQHENFTIGLIEDAFMALFEQKGLNLTVREICDLAGISRPVFYRLYDDKFDVLEGIEKRLIEELAKINNKMPSAAYRSDMKAFPYVEESAVYVYENRKFFGPLIGSPGEVNFINRWCRLMRNDMMRRLTNEKKMLENTEVYTYSISRAAIGVYEYWLKYAPDMSVGEITQIITNLWKTLY